jgi:cytosine/uracil/thiamine/allantoin permease
MAQGLGSPIKIIGIILLVVGAGLAIWGYQLSGSVGSQISEAVTGSETDKVMMYYIGGAASFFVGLYLFAKN